MKLKVSKIQIQCKRNYTIHFNCAGCGRFENY